jgi:hypothetical protein
MASCCLDKSDGKLRKRVKSLQPPSPVTNFAHPKCYLRSTHDCSEDISREHYISANILEQLGSSISVIGFPFLAPNETNSFAIDNLTSKILCRRHNEALSPLDQEAEIFFRELSLSLSDLEKAPSRTHNIHLASGSALELWMLKTACGMYFSRIAAKDNVRLAGTHRVDEAKITAAFFENKWDDRAGLYFNGHYGSAMTTMAGIVVRTLSEDIGSLFSGVRIALLGIEFDLLFDTTGASPGPWPGIVRRPSELIFEKNQREHAIILTWPQGTPEASIRFGTDPPSGVVPLE